MEARISEDYDAKAALRAELEREIKNKKQCIYASYECTQLALDGYKYCARHILQDKNAPFKQCTFVYGSNGKRCYLPAPWTDKKEYGYCHEHALKATLIRNKQNSKYPPPSTAEVLANSLTHYIKKPRTGSISSSTDDGDEGAELKITRSNDPLVDLDANSIYNDLCNEIMDYCSESESDVEASNVSSVWQDFHADSSNDESVDSEAEDPLKHANVYTAEEITQITKDKLVRLQSLYIEQYRHLKYLLREKRRKYLYSVKREKETCCNIYSQIRDNPREQRLYKKLKALNNYHRCHGVEGILSKRQSDLRAKMADGTTHKMPSSSKCTFTEGGVKCGEKVLPLAKHCLKHILEDSNQVLFKPCGKMTDDVKCTMPIAAIFEDSTCPLHEDIPSLKSYNQIRKDSESDMDDSAETHLPHYPQFSENVKHEFLDYIPPEIPKMDTVPTMLFEENSQSMSESTISQNEVFSSNFDNGSYEKLNIKTEDMQMKNNDLENVTLDEDDLKDNRILYHLGNSHLNESSSMKNTLDESNSVLNMSQTDDLHTNQSVKQEESVNQSQMSRESSVQGTSQNFEESHNLKNPQAFINLQNEMELQNSQDLQTMQESQSDILNDSGSTSEMSGLLLCEDSPVPTLDETIGIDEASSVEFNKHEITLADDSTVINSEEVITEGTTLNQNSELMEIDEVVKKVNIKEENKNNDESFVH